MRYTNINLVNGNNLSVKNASVELSDSTEADTFFGTDLKKENATNCEVAKWCTEQIAQYKRYIQNLKMILIVTRLQMSEGVTKEEFDTHVRQNVIVGNAVA